MESYSFEELTAGQREAIELNVSAADIRDFAKLSGDVSPIHVDETYAQQRGFPGCVAHGALLIAFASRLIGTRLPGRHGLLQKLEMQFRLPCFAGDQIRVVGEVLRKIEAVRAIQIAITIENVKTGEVIANGKGQSGIAEAVAIEPA